MHLIAVDIGNSSTKIAIAGTGNRDWQLELVVRDESGNSLSDIQALIPDEPSFWVVSSVNQTRQERLSNWISTCRPNDDLHVVSPNEIELESDIESRARLGRDRLIAGWMAVELNDRRGPVVVVDAGTAVTIDWIDDRMIFQGGFIFPGADLGFLQLSKTTDALPYLSRVDRLRKLDATNRTIDLQTDRGRSPFVGKSTESAILQGIYQSQIAGITGIVERLTSLSPKKTQVYMTGGGITEINELSHAFPDAFPTEWNVVPDLVLLGTRAIGASILAGRSE